MTAPATRRAVYEDLFDLPDNLIGEIVDGELYAQPRPAGPHTIVASGLGADLTTPFDRGIGRPGGWIVLFEPELHLGADILVPDLAGWRVERLPAVERAGAYFTVAPDWVCEVVSTGTATRDRSVKAPAYAQHQVDFLWLVEPLGWRVEAFKRVEAQWLWLGTWTDTEDARIPPFDAVGLNLSRLWQGVGKPAGEST